MTSTGAERTIRLQVARARDRDAGRDSARMGRRTFDELGLSVGDVVEVRGTLRSAVRAASPLSEDRPLDVIRLDGLQRTNAGAAIGEFVTLRRIEAPVATEVRIGPLSKGAAFSDGATLPSSLLDGFPLSPGNVISVMPSRQGDSGSGGSGSSAGGAHRRAYHVLGETRFVVLETAPADVVQVGEGTRIEIDTAPVTAESSAGGPAEIPAEASAEGPGEGPAKGPAEAPARPARRRAGEVTYDDLGGMEGAIRQIREMVEVPLKHPQLFRNLGVEPPQGVLLHGPPGTGKTLLARAVASESGVNFLHLAGPEIMGRYYGESEERLREIFREAQEQGPSVIFIDEIDSIAPRREDARGDVERRVVAQLLDLMDGLERPDDVVVLAATNRVDALDEALRRPGRFDREIEIGAPDRNGRREILGIHTRGIPLEDVDLDTLAGETHGFVGADLASLVREAVMDALRRSLRGVDPGDTEAVAGLVGDIRVTVRDFEEARARVSPSALREIHVEVAEVGWDDVGGLEEVKATLREGIELPLKRPDDFRRLGIRPPRGFLLYGPPGTGKTLLGRAVAREAEANFILARASSLLSRWYGESERQVARIFARARQVAPTVVFIDEIDTLAPRRQERPGEPVATERVVNTLLAEMDGMEATEGVVVIGATNRPMLLDPALLRPGRFDELIYIPVPHRDGRLHILGVHTRRMPLGEDVDLEGLADRTEGYTGADLEDLVRRAGTLALREAPDTEGISASFFERALEETGASVTPEVAEEYEEIARSLEEDSVRGHGRIGF